MFNRRSKSITFNKVVDWPHSPAKNGTTLFASWIKAAIFQHWKFANMISTFICRHCGLTCRCNPHIKNQKYCSSLTCQNARKRMHDKRTNATLRGKSSQKVRNKEWRANRPAHEYQKNYRDTHPEYVKRNRDLQRERNKKRQNAQTPMIVKTDALSLRP